jgi:hypothetical protein
MASGWYFRLDVPPEPSARFYATLTPKERPRGISYPVNADFLEWLRLFVVTGRDDRAAMFIMSGPGWKWRG